MKTLSQIEKQRRIFSEKSKNIGKYQLENFRLSYLKRIQKGLNIPSDGVYLDIGCGALGHLVIEAARKNQEACGMDLTREMVVKARNFAKKELGRENKKYTFLVGKAEEIPFSDEFFSKVSAVAVLEHIEDDEKAIAQIARVTKKGGLVFITVPNAYDKIFFPFRLYYQKVDKEMGHLRHYLAKDLKKRFEKYGFSSKEINYTGHWPKILQYGLTLLFPKFTESTWWWKLEEMDFNLKKKDSGLHVDIIMEKRK